MVPVCGTPKRATCGRAPPRSLGSPTQRAAARSRASELSGSTITITSLGALGGIVTTPVINHPEVAIVGVNRVVERPMMRGGAIVPRRMMNLSSSFDHRVVDGMRGAAVRAGAARLSRSARDAVHRLMETPTPKILFTS